MRLHPLTAVVNAASYAGRVGSLAVFAVVAGRTATPLPARLLLGIAVVGVVVSGAYGVARYLAFEYDLGPETLTIQSGVVRRQSREIPLDRVQNVDVERSALARVLGLAVVRFETAGGGATEGELRLVGADRARELQDELRRRTRGESGAEQEPALLYELSTPELLVLAGVSFRWGAVPLVLFSTPLAEDLLVATVRRVLLDVVLGGPPSLSDPRLLGVALLVVAGYLLAAWLVGAAITVVQYYGFRLARVDDQLVYERGLVRRYSGSVPLEKVQALAVAENVAMRRLGYAALTIETAGYGPGGNGGERSPSAVPLAARERVLELVAAIEGVDDVAVDRPPRRARRRYAGRYALVALGVGGVLGAVHLAVLPLGVVWALPAALLVAAAPAAHLKWANRGHRAGESHFLTRTGVWRRTTRVVPYYRLQTVVTERTVFQRRWNLASVVGDTASSSLRERVPTAHDVDDATARRLHETLLERLRADLARRRADRPDRRPPTDDG